MGAKYDFLRIIRYADTNQVLSRTDCFSSQITILSDDASVNLIPYQKALSGQPVEDKFRITLDNETFDPSGHCFVGFDESLPEDIKPVQFLCELGLEQGEAESILKKYDLEKSSYLMCSQLPAPAKRQLVLLKAIWSDADVLVLNDPFQPFSGRWREHFAELLLEEAVGKGRLIIVMNLSFEPKSWGESDSVRQVKVKEVERVAEPEVDKKTSDLAKAAEEALDKPKSYDEKRITVKVPTVVVEAYNVTTDFIFEPLARISNFCRSFSGALVMGASACVVVLLAVVMVPNLSGARLKIAEMAERYDSTEGVKTFLSGMWNRETVPAVKNAPAVKVATRAPGVVKDAPFQPKGYESEPVGMPVGDEREAEIAQPLESVAGVVFDWKTVRYENANCGKLSNSKEFYFYSHCGNPVSRYNLSDPMNIALAIDPGSDFLGE